MDAPELTESTTPGQGERVPTVVASHVSITYRVFSPGRPAEEDESDEASALRKLLRGPRGIGVREVEAVKDVSFMAYRGESIGVLGTNGSGKSTLLRTIAGLVPPTSGQLWLNGRAALLGVNAVLMSKLSGRRNIWIGASMMSSPTRNRPAINAATRADSVISPAQVLRFIFAWRFAAACASWDFLETRSQNPICVSGWMFSALARLATW